MSFSGQILMFLGVASIYIGFTFVWAWYKGRQDSEQTTTRTVDEERGGEH